MSETAVKSKPVAEKKAAKGKKNEAPPVEIAPVEVVPTEGRARFVFPGGSVYEGGWLLVTGDGENITTANTISTTAATESKTTITPTPRGGNNINNNKDTSANKNDHNNSINSNKDNNHNLNVSNNPISSVPRKVRHGMGIWQHLGDRYEGDWYHDMIDGHGTYHYRSGASYTGSWKKNTYHGKGRYVWPNEQAYYEGEWQYNHMHGQGTLVINGATSPDQQGLEILQGTEQKWTGLFQNDQFINDQGQWIAPPLPVRYSQIISS